ncbi:unnamed protein product [Rotaria socialis]|uniref:Uncharacterized protein n=1 Tax=Rotaria socialis TaxID=392032 RepID=A0A820UEZ7_9BILA|nr:unnamed protein product [Rotaria socialis]CAF4483260.1 unnamed protein product [Rotaria socialis]
MDHWIASGIEEDIDLGLEKQQTLNKKRNDRRKQNSNIGDRMDLSDYCNLSDDCRRGTRDNESMVSDASISQHAQKIPQATSLSSSLIYDITSFMQLNYEQSNDDDTDDDVEAVQKQQQVA